MTQVKDPLSERLSSTFRAPLYTKVQGLALPREVCNPGGVPHSIKFLFPAPSSRNRPQRIYDIPPRRRTRRHHRAQQSYQRRHYQRLSEDPRRHPYRSKRPAHIANRESLQDEIGRATSDNSADKSYQQRL